MSSFINEAVQRFENISRAAELKPAKTQPQLHPLNDPQEWARTPAYDAPLSKERIAHRQKEIDSIYGVTRDNQPILKLVWSGDRDFWREYYMKWDAGGRPVGELCKRPLLVYKKLRDPNTNELIRDVFPPRWLILTRLEPEQYADTWFQESYVYEPQLNCQVQIRPDKAPPVYWMWYATVAEHNGHCCVLSDKNREICYGAFADPEAVYPTIANQKAVDTENGLHHPFQKINTGHLLMLDNQHNNYRYELRKLVEEREIFLAHPFALIGAQMAYAKDMTVKKAYGLVKNFYDKKIQDTAAKADAAKRID